jgi:PPM family protein phosphatase
VGLRRGNNQDSLAVGVASDQSLWRARGHIFMVADGMGAHAAGELASRLATDAVPLIYHKLTDLLPPDALLTAMKEANAQIHARGQSSSEFKGMGTTGSVLVLLPQGALVAQVGDSRVYRLRGNRFEQLTFDHSLVWEMRAAGQIPAGQVPDFIPKNVITRSLGPNPTVQADIEGPFPTAIGDTFLLCSDGLSGPVKDEEMGTILRCLPPDDAVRALVDLANLRGGPDNVTVIVAKIAAPEATSTGSNEARPRAKRITRPVHPALWIVLGVLAVAALGGAVAGAFWFALGSLLAAAAVGTAVGLRAYGGRRIGLPFDGRQLGRGPYTAVNCPPTAEFVARLAEIVRQLREAAVEEQWNVDWNRFNTLFDQAAAANQSGDHAQAVRHYCGAMSFMMEQLKGQGKR